MYNCRTVPKERCNRCGKGIFGKVIRVIKEGKIPFWNEIKKKWENESYYHSECAPIIIYCSDLEWGQL